MDFTKFGIRFLYFWSLERFQILDDRVTIVGRDRRTDHSVSSRSIFKLVTMIVIAWLRDVVKITAFDFTCVVAHVGGVKLLASRSKPAGPLALRRK
jgi:hypothetical protein